MSAALFFILLRLLTSHLLRKKMGASLYCFVVSFSGLEGVSASPVPNFVKCVFGLLLFVLFPQDFF